MKQKRQRQQTIDQRIECRRDEPTINRYQERPIQSEKLQSKRRRTNKKYTPINACMSNRDRICRSGRDLKNTGDTYGHSCPSKEFFIYGK